MHLEHRRFAKEILQGLKHLKGVKMRYLVPISSESGTWDKTKIQKEIEKCVNFGGLAKQKQLILEFYPHKACHEGVSSGGFRFTDPDPWVLG